MSFKDPEKDELLNWLIMRCEQTTGMETSKQTKRLLRSAVKSLNFKGKGSAKILQSAPRNVDRGTQVPGTPAHEGDLGIGQPD